jgi:MFS family permease
MSTDVGIMSGINIMPQYQQYFGVAALGGATGLIFSLFYAGAFVAIAIGPFLADKFGRKMPIMVGSSVALVGAIIQASSQSSINTLVTVISHSRTIPCGAIHPRVRLVVVFCLWTVVYR